jgi:hypothetical protein
MHLPFVIEKGFIGRAGRDKPGMAGLVPAG